MNILISDLIHLNNASKLLKNKNFIILDNTLIGLDNCICGLTYMEVDPLYITPTFNNLNKFIFNARELSAFLKAISTESNFEIYDGMSNVIKTFNGTELNLLFDPKLIYTSNNIMSKRYDYPVVLCEEERNIDIEETLKSMKNSDGARVFIHKGFYMTLFPSLFNMLKSDALYITILDNPSSENAFVARFRVKKKKNDCFIYLAFLNVI